MNNNNSMFDLNQNAMAHTHMSICQQLIVQFTDARQKKIIILIDEWCPLHRLKYTHVRLYGELNEPNCVLFPCIIGPRCNECITVNRNC